MAERKRAVPSLPSSPEDREHEHRPNRHGLRRRHDHAEPHARAFFRRMVAAARGLRRAQSLSSRFHAILPPRDAVEEIWLRFRRCILILGFGTLSLSIAR